MIQDQNRESIIAQCTPNGSGAIALLRISGDNAITLVDAMCRLSTQSSYTSLKEVKTHTIHYGDIITSDNNSIDHVLFLVMHTPNTFTGQETVEITCHNNPFIIERIIARAIECGIRPAMAGEFSRRAVLNNKIDITQAEAIHELITANTENALQKSLAQLDGTLASWTQDMEQQLYKALSLSEASFEFIDEENPEFDDQIRAIIETVIENIKIAQQSFDQQQRIREGIRISIIGTVNAGKSSLFNAITKSERAIVTDVAGTTRDSIEAGMYKGGNYWTVIDTAGIRETDNTIEQMGIDRSFKEAHKADIILLVFDGSRVLSEKELCAYNNLLNRYASKVICIKNKIDLAQHKQHAIRTDIAASSTTNINIDVIHHAIQRKIDALFSTSESPFLLNKRQFSLLVSCLKKLKTIIEIVDKKPVAYELLSYHLTDSIACFSQLTGKSISEEGMDRIFRDFCVGK